jgi:hypothetical protein
MAMPELPYRALPPPEPPDPEALAVHEITLRVTRLRRRVFFACLGPTALLSLVGYQALLFLQFALFQLAEFRFSAVVGFGVPLILGFRATDLALRHALRTRVPRWVDDLAAKYAVPRESLSELTAHLE